MKINCAIVCNQVFDLLIIENKIRKSSENCDSNSVQISGENVGCSKYPAFFDKDIVQK
jgi:hypothetical protein